MGFPSMVLPLMITCSLWPCQQQSTTPSSSLTTKDIITESTFKATKPKTPSSISNVAPLISTQSLMDFSKSNISVYQSSISSYTMSGQSLTPYNMMISSQSTTTRRMTPATILGKRVPEPETILTGAQKTIDVECSTGECLDGNPKEITTPKLIQDVMPVDSLSGQRQFDCELRVDVSGKACQKTINQTEWFFCINLNSSCRDNCGKIFGSCSCDINCGIYNDCCDDFEDVCPDIFEDAKRSLGGLLDVKIECVGEYNSYLVIAGCPENYTSSDLKIGCEDGEILINSIDGLHFKNVACLRCNGFKEDESEKWSMSVHVNYERTTQVSFFTGLDVKKVMKIWSSIWEVPEKFSNVIRICSRSMIEECPAGSDGYLVEKCSTSNGNVLVKSQNTINIYKNIYCADCHTKSDFFCRGTPKNDYQILMRVGRFSSVISLTFDKESERFELEAKTPFLWRKAKCIEPVDNLTCQITKCFIDIPPVNNTCGLQKTETCVWMEFSTSSDASKADLVDFRKLMTNVSISHPDLKIYTSAHVRDYTSRMLKFELVFTMWTGPFPYTLDDLYDSYASFADGLLIERGLEGKFTLCFNITREITSCTYMKCTTRHYTIQDPSNQGSVSNGGEGLFICSREGDKHPVALIIVVVCLIFILG